MTRINWQAFWQKKNLIHYCLLPFSLIFFIISFLRKKAYQHHLLISKKSPIPVVIIGNINIGGSGKTPLVIALGELLSQKGISYAVISKGYGRDNSKQTHILKKKDLANIVGDEPLLIKNKLNCPVVVSNSRLKAIKLIQKKFNNTQIILSDDGLQDYKLQHDLEIAVINHQVGLGNCFLLPAGPLREPKSRLKSVDFIVNNGNTTAPYHYQLQPKNWHHIHLDLEKEFSDFINQKRSITAISGIAHPSLFFDLLENSGIKAKFIAYPDHHRFSYQDLPQDQTILMTEKDWIKIREFDHKDSWFLDVSANPNQSFKEHFIQKVNQIIDQHEKSKL